MTVYKTGVYAPSPYNPKDYFATVKPTALPESFRKPPVPIRDQAAGNCVEQAIARRYYRVHGKRFGVSFGYGLARDWNRPSPGLIPSEALEFHRTNGILPFTRDSKELEVVEVINHAKSLQATYGKEALPYADFAYFKVYNEYTAKAALYDGYEVIFCFRGNDFQTDGFGVMHAASNDTAQWLHEVVIDGWEPHKTYSGTSEMAYVANSWGEGWGNQGYCWMSWEDVFAVGDVWAIKPIAEVPNDTIIELKRTLRKGIKGDDVAQLQQALIKLGYDLGKWGADGSFGDATFTAVKAYQRTKGLEVDGIVGKNTWRSIFGTAPEDIWTPDPRIKDLQLLLELQVGDPYVIGGQGDVLTEAYLDSKLKTHPGYFTNGRGDYLRKLIRMAQKSQRELKCGDCSGAFWWAESILNLVPASDSTADGLFNRYCRPIRRDEMRAGDMAFRRDSSGSIVHIAIMGYGAMYEQAGTAYGMDRHENVDDRKVYNCVTNAWDTLKPWTDYGRPTFWA